MRVAWVGFLLLLVACVPALAPVATRSDGDVVITFAAVRDVFDVRVVVLNAVTADERCGQFDADLSCALGNISARNAVSLVVQGPVGQVACVAYGFVREDLSPASYRPYPCAVR